MTPVICLSERRCEPFKSDRVAVVPRQYLLGWLREQRNTPAEFARLARFAETI